MESRTAYDLWIAHNIHDRLIADASREHLARSSTDRPQPIRRAIGRSIIRIGERLAAEPSIGPARSI